MGFCRVGGMKENGLSFLDVVCADGSQDLHLKPPCPIPPAPGARAGTSPSETGVGTVTGLSRKVAHCLLSSALTGLALPCCALPGGREPSSLFTIDFSVVAPPLFITHCLSSMLWPSWK